MLSLEGEGWRLVLDPERQPYAVLIGGADWAAELQLEEALALMRGLHRLQVQHAALADGLMAEEAISLELETPITPEQAAAPGAGLSGAGVLWLELVGDRQRWSLRFVLTPEVAVRGVEGGWSELAAPAFAAALAAALPEALPQLCRGRSGVAHETGGVAVSDQQC